MNTLKLTLRPLAPFGTPLVGDVLFGHLCWAARERYGESRLTELLEGYTAGRPFLAVSDAFPEGFVPRPTAPDALLGRAIDPKNRKQARQLGWLPIPGAQLPIAEWLAQAQKCDVADIGIATQNTINRLTGTTDVDLFAPRQVEHTAYRSDVRLDIHVVLDESRLSRDALRGLFEDVGAIGYGRDASTGLGKLAIEAIAEHSWPNTRTRHWLTLAPCAPDVPTLDAAHCYYQPMTRFGRHGNIGVRLGVPFKRPLLMLKTAALLTTRERQPLALHGRGLGGRAAPLSFVIPDTVQQGYAPVVPLSLELPS